MDKNSKIYLAGHTGLVGSAIMRKLQKEGFNNLLIRRFEVQDLTDQAATFRFFKEEKPEYVILAAARVGGIMANNIYRADFIWDNIQIQSNVIRAAYRERVKKLLFLGSSCIYPKNAPQPLKEEYLLTSELEYTNEPYAIAKIAGIKTCEAYNIQYGTNFISVMPTNLYGFNDNFHLVKSHVLPAFIRKFYLAALLQEENYDLIQQDLVTRPVEEFNTSSHEAIENELNKQGVYKDRIKLWGSGKPMREFLYSEDLAEACIYILQHIDFKDLYDHSNKEIRNTHINIGTGRDLTIRDLAEKIAGIAGFTGEIVWDSSKPDGTYRKVLDTSKINSLGWKPKTSLDEGLKKVFEYYRASSTQNNK